MTRQVFSVLDFYTVAFRDVFEEEFFILSASQGFGVPVGKDPRSGLLWCCRIPFGDLHTHVFEDVSSEGPGGIGWFVVIAASNAWVHGSDFSFNGSVGCVRSVSAVFDTKRSGNLRTDWAKGKD